ncbi:hypothetical protein ACFE04_027385 [Oxalis oulophora]
MTRKKVKLAYIPNDSSRKATYKKRKKGLMKKVGELSTLCGIEACAIVYSPYDSQPEIWPSTIGAQRVVSQFKKMPEMEQSKKMVNQESFIRQRIAKSTEQLKKQRKENREKEITEVMYQTLGGKVLHGLSMMDLNDLGWMIDQNLKEIDKRCETLTNSASSSSSVVVVPEVSAPPPQPLSPQPLSPPPPPAEANFMVRNENGVQMGQAQAQQPPWFMDLLNGQDQQQMGYANEEEMMMVPYAGNNNNNNNNNHNNNNNNNNNNHNHNNNPAWPHGFFP